MRIINIIEQSSGVITNVTSFCIYEEQLSNEVVEKAEEFFKTQILKNEYFENEENIEDILDNALDNGHYEQENKNYYTIDFIWGELN
jgi:hypothetical protein